MTAVVDQPVLLSAPGGIRRTPVPDREPPYDDETSGTVRALAPIRRQPRGHSRQPNVVQGTLALAFVLPSGVVATPTPSSDLRLLPEQSSAAEHVDEEEFGPQPTARADLPCPKRWAAKFVQAMVETLAGDRPASQLVRWTTRDVHDALARRTSSGPRPAGAPRPVVRSVHVTEPAVGIAEVAALVRCGARCRAVALRLEGLDGRWQCSAVEVG